MKFFKNIFSGLIRFVYCIVIILLLCFIVISHPTFVSQNIVPLINAHLPQNQELLIKNISFSKIEPAIKSITIHDVSFTIKQEKNIYSASANFILLSQENCFNPSRECQLIINNLNIKNKDLAIEGINIHLIFPFNIKTLTARGTATIDTIKYQDYLLTKIAALIKINEDSIIMNRILAKAYQGEISSEGKYQFLPKEYIKMQGSFKDINTSKINVVNSKLKGLLSGQIEFEGTSTKIKKLAVDFTSSSSEMEKTLFKYLMGDINNNLSFLPFAKMLEKVDFIQLDNFEGTIHNTKNDSADIKLKVSSHDLNLNLNPTITINLR